MAPATAGAVLFRSRPPALRASGSSPGGAMPTVKNPGRFFGFGLRLEKRALLVPRS